MSDCFVLIGCLEALFSLQSLKLAARVFNIFKGQLFTFVHLKYRVAIEGRVAQLERLHELRWVMLLPFPAYQH